MEVKEVFKLKDPESGRNLNVHLSDEEVKEIMQAGFVFLLQLGHINYRHILAEHQQEQLVLPGTEPTKQ